MRQRRAVEALRGLIQVDVDAYGGMYTSKGLAEIVGNGINRVLPQLLENKATRSLVLANLKQVTGTEVKLRDGQNLWDVANEQGKSLRMILQENIRTSSDLSDQSAMSGTNASGLSGFRGRKPQRRTGEIAIRRSKPV